MKQGVKTSTEAKSQPLQPLRIIISAANLPKKQGISGIFNKIVKKTMLLLQQNSDN
jgi:hypothetical protein